MYRPTFSKIKAGAVIALTLGVAFGTAVQSHAQAPFDAHFELQIKNGIWGTVAYAGNPITDFMGAFTFDIVNPVGGVPGITDPFDAYCIDLFTAIGYGEPFGVYFKSTDDYMPPKGAGAAWLYNNFADLASGNDEKSGGLQIAIWESLYDDTIDLDGGNFQTVAVDANAKAFANTYLTAWSGQSAKAIWLDTYTLDGQYRAQSLIGPLRIPEPSTVGLLALGGLAFAGYVRRRSR